jgi:hypothetical protein
MTRTYKAQRSSGPRRSGRPAATHLALVAVTRTAVHDGNEMTSTDSTPKARTALRTAFGVVLFVVWAVMTFLWFYDAIHALVHGQPGLVIKAVVWLLLMLLLAGMEGLEVAVIDRWSNPARRPGLARHPLRGDPVHRSSGPQDLQPCLDNAHRAVVHADLPEAHGGDECGPLSESLSIGAVPGR